MDKTQPTPLPRIARFENLGFGLFLHYGLYSLVGQGEWIQDFQKTPPEEYAKLKDQFTASGFNGRAIARLARESGMRYACLTTRHHDGFSLYDTRGVVNFDVPHSSAGRDLVVEFVEGCGRRGSSRFSIKRPWIGNGIPSTARMSSSTNTSIISSANYGDRRLVV